MMPLYAPNLRTCDHFSCQLGDVQNQGELWGSHCVGHESILSICFVVSVMLCLASQLQQA